MSVAAVIELSHELHRLAIAGVALAKGDRRVAAIVPTLERSGEQAAVFAHIAERTNALLTAARVDAPVDFLQLNTLVGAVLKTQGRTALDGELVPLPPSSAVGKRIPAHAMHELREGLHGSRMDTLHDAIDRGWFGDARLAPFALEALQSEHAEIANLAATKMIPPYGRAIVPLLVASLDLALKRPASRLIETVQRVDPESAATLARQVLDPELDPGAEWVFAMRTDGASVSDEARVAALACLGEGDGDRAILLDFLDANKKALRVACLRRLLAFGDAEGEARVLAMLKVSAKKAREAIESIPALTGPEMSVPVVARAHALAQRLGDEQVSTTDANAAVCVLSLLVRSETDPKRFDAVFALFERLETLRRHSSELRADTLQALLDYLVGACPVARRETLVRLAMPLEPGLTTLAAIRRLGPAEALPLLRQARWEDFRKGLGTVFPSGYGGAPHRAMDLPPPSAWNTEWLELGLRHGLIDLVDHLWSLDPARVVRRTLAWRGVRREEHAIQALIADPGCAAKLRRKLSRELREHALLDALCEAIVCGERARYLSVAGELSARYGRERVATLRTRLANRSS